MADLEVDSMSDAELRTKLAEHGFPVMPITASTRKLLVKKMKLVLSDKGKSRNSMDPKSDARSSGRPSVARQAPVAEQSTSRAEPLSMLEKIFTPRDKIGEVELSQIELDENILSLLGDAPRGKNIHEAISSRWLEVLTKGLAKDAKDKYNQEYLVPGNCEMLFAPILNPEAKAAMTDFMLKRDQSFLQKQQQLGTALAALAQATEMLISKQPQEKVLKPLSDACRMLCDSHFQITDARRSLVISFVEPELRDTLVNTARDKFLFGEKLAEQMKPAQNVQSREVYTPIPPAPRDVSREREIHQRVGRSRQTQSPSMSNMPQRQRFLGRSQQRSRSPAPRISYRK